jgi:hypothetical protein
MQIQTVRIYNFGFGPIERKFEYIETFERQFKQLLGHYRLNFYGDFTWHRQNPDGTETPVKLTYTNTPESLGMQLNHVEKITWKQAVVFSAMKGDIV